MSEEVTIKTKFERQNQPKQYETARASVELEVTFPGSFTPEQMAEDGKALFQVAKALVFNELGMPYEQDSATGIIMEVFPGSNVVELKPAPAPNEPAPAPRRVRAVPQAPEPDEGTEIPNEPQEAATEAPRTRRAARPAPAPAAGMETDDYWDDLEKNPGDWWDNRATKNNPKGPDFTSSKYKKADGYRVALWLNTAPDWFVLPEGPFRPSQSR